MSEIRGPADTASDLRRSIDAIAALDRSAQSNVLRRVRDAENHPGLKSPIDRKLHEIALGGEQVVLENARAGVPWLIRRLLELCVLTTAQAAQMVRRLGVVSLPDLETALDDRRLSQLLPAPAADRLREAALQLRHEAPQIPLGRALDLVDGLVADLVKADGALTRLTPAGGARRFEPLVRDVVVAAAAADPPAAIASICMMPSAADVLHRTGRRATLRYEQVEVDVRVAAPEEYGTMLFAATGSPGHVAAVGALRARPALWPEEEDVYRQAGLPWIAPELRHASGEVEAAARASLPSLIERAHIRGDLHMHSTYSDGRDRMGDMAAACSALGYEYVAFTDHSQRASASRTLSIDDLAKQRDEIAALRERFPRMAILHGVEVDILLDGSLDFPDSVLQTLDIVLASLHDAGRQDGRTLTRRCIQAIRHPLVNIITHPANRLVGRHPGYALDFGAIYAAAAETGTALEIDGAPAHLDLDGERARAAIAAGVTVAIDSDCHRAHALERQMLMGVGTARRGWVEPRHVLNTRPLDAVRAFVAAKRL